MLSVLVGFAFAGCTQNASAGSHSTASSFVAASSASSSAGSASPASATGAQAASASGASAVSVTKDGTYTDKEHVALYIHLYGHVPSNYVTKTKARKAGWVNTEGNLWDVLPGKSIGGGGFNNDDGTLPDAPGREWFECDIDYDGGYRNEKRIVYSDDGLVFYTGDHYKTFEQLY